MSAFRCCPECGQVSGHFSGCPEDHEPDDVEELVLEENEEEADEELVDDYQENLIVARLSNMEKGRAQ